MNPNGSCNSNPVNVSEQKTFLDLIISPNPFTTQTRVEVNESNLEEIRAKMFDVYGREVKEFVTRNSPFVISRDGLPGGVYFIRLAAGEKIVTEKLVITD
jgi:hypothetical protein